MTDPDRNALLERLQADPAICGGVVCIKGTRITRARTFKPSPRSR